MTSAVGGGSMPEARLASRGLRLTGRAYSAEKAAEWFRRRKIPIVGIIVGDRLCFDFRTVFPEEENELIAAVHEWSARPENTERPGK